MSHAEHGYAHPPAEEDRVPTARIAAVGIAALVVFAVGAVAAGLGMQSIRRQVNPDGPPALPAEAGKAKIGMVEQRLFQNANQGLAWRAQAERQLGSYGWVDPQKRIAHIPIDRAIDLSLKGARP
jgi:hypothetical protein